MAQAFWPGLFLSFMPVLGFAASDAFLITELPTGKSVTLPHPALTLIPLSESVRLTSTDSTQTIKISLANPVPGAYKIAIFDPNSAGVKYLKIQKNAAAMYTFRDLSTIQLVPQNINNTQGAQLMIESNRPLGISR